MKRYLIRAAAFTAAAFFLTASVTAAPSVSARSAILMDADSGQVLYEKDADTQSLIASTTKIMTALLVCEQCDLKEEFCVPSAACGIEGSSMYLKPGERVTVEELLYGLMLQSGNDAAVALAVHCRGSVQVFVDQMNARARSLSLQQTHFANPNGLDSAENYSTPRDMAGLTACAMRNETFRRVVSTRSVTLGDRTLTNHNKLLWKYTGANGVKTGYTRAAGRILVSSAERDRRNLIAVTFSAPDDWNDHAQMLDYGFTQYRSVSLLRGGQIVGSVPVFGGTQEKVRLVADRELKLSVAQGEVVSFRLIAPHYAFAPVLQGPAGCLECSISGRAVASIPLYYERSVS